jgi:hypothetical protein
MIVATMRLRFLASERRRPDQFTVSWTHFHRVIPFAASIPFIGKKKYIDEIRMPWSLLVWKSRLSDAYTAEQ